MPKKKLPSTLMLKDPNNILGTMVTMNRCARKAYPNNPTQRIHPIKRDSQGNYYREDQNEVKKQGERVRAQADRRRQSFQRELAAAKALRRASEANQRDAEKRRNPENEVPTGGGPVGGSDDGGAGGGDGVAGCEDRSEFACADRDG